MISKLLPLLLLCFSFKLHALELGTLGYTPLIIKMAHNLSSTKLLLGKTDNSNTQAEVIPLSKRPVLLEKDYKIPFISIKYYMKQFTRNIPYVPQEALKVKTARGLYRIWESEAGVTCAPDPKNIRNLLQWEPSSLLKVNSHGPEGKLAHILKLLLLVNHNGELSLKRLQ